MIVTNQAGNTITLPPGKQRVYEFLLAHPQGTRLDDIAIELECGRDNIRYHVYWLRDCGLATFVASVSNRFHRNEPSLQSSRLWKAIKPQAQEDNEDA